jgi:carbon-monoxide dehydrogenase medium subunit
VTVLPPFEIHRAGSVTEAARLMDELGDEAVYYCGGTELLLLMKLGFASYGHLIDVKPIEALGRLEVREGNLVIGAAVTHRALERSPLVRSGWPDLAEMERGVANVRVRNTGTLGGNLAFADPHSDPATFLLAAGASVRVGRDETGRRLPIDEFVTGPYETALSPGELLCAIEVPALPPGAAMCHLRFAFHERPAATVSAWVLVRGGLVEDARVAVGSVGVRPVTVPGVAGTTSGQDAKAIEPAVLASIGEAAAEAAEPVSDANGGEDYKRALVLTLVGRALAAAAARAAYRAASRKEAGT